MKTSSKYLVVGVALVITIGFIYAGSVLKNSREENKEADVSVVEPLFDINSLFGQPLTEVVNEFSSSTVAEGRVLVKTDSYDLAIAATKDSATSNFVMAKFKTMGDCNKSNVDDFVKETAQLSGLDYSMFGTPTDKDYSGDTISLQFCDYPDQRYQIDFVCSVLSAPVLMLGTRVSCN